MPFIFIRRTNIIIAPIFLLDCFDKYRRLQVATVLHPSGREETVSITKIMEQATRPGKFSGGVKAIMSHSSWKQEFVPISSQNLVDKLRLLLSYKKFTEMNPCTRQAKITACDMLLRKAEIEILRNEMAEIINR